MPKISITQAFNFQSGGVTKHFKKGEQDVPQAVADHALAHGFTPKPKADKKAEAEASATKA
ncbi:glycogen branching protein [Pseudomonas sp. CrR14]|nr:glycogen branching protein [Pseudomonas sp. CrR14]